MYPYLRALATALMASALLLIVPLPAVAQESSGISPVPYTLTDGTRLTGYLSLPPNFRDGERYPAILLLHGWHGVNHRHPQGLAESYLKEKIHQKYLQQKYVVFSGEYFADYLGDPREFESLAAALQTMVSLAAVDARRLAVVGSSHGGYLALMCMVRPDIQPKPKVGVSISGVVDVADWVGYLQKNKGNPVLLPGLREYAGVTIPRALGWPPDENPRTRENFARASVLTYLKDLHGPILIIHSAGDKQVPISQAYTLRQALQQEHKPFEFEEVPAGKGDGHFIFLNNVSVWQTIAAYLDKNL